MDIRIQKLEPGNYYHIYNRGINGEETFSNKDNFDFFLSKVQKFISPYFEIFSYCLMSNHFHFLLSPIEVKDKVFSSESGLHSAEHFYSKQIGKLINSYSQAYNKITNRHGPLFESPFKRKLVKSEDQLKKLLLYIHNNPRDLGFQPKDYKYCSYVEIISNRTLLVSKESIKWFDNLDNYIFCHDRL